MEGHLTRRRQPFPRQGHCQQAQAERSAAVLPVSGTGVGGADEAVWVIVALTTAAPSSPASIGGPVRR
jgi:hypothetical protein